MSSKRPSLPRDGLDWVKTLSNVIPVPLAISRLQGGDLVFINERLAQTLGVDGGPKSGGRLTDYFFDATESRDLMEALRREGRIRDFELRLKRADGSPVWTLASIEPARFSGEQVQLAAFFEITKRKRAEQELAVMVQFPEMNPAALLRVDRSATILLANAASRALFRDEHLVGRSWLELCPDIDVARWDRVLNAHVPERHETEINQRCIMFDFQRTADGAFVLIYGIDITDLKRAEQELAVMVQFPEMNPGALFRVDRSGKILLANAASRALFRDEHLIGRSWLDLCPGVDAPLWDRVINGTVMERHEAEINQRRLMFDFRRTTEGDLVLIYGTDITNERTAERALRQSEKMATLGTLAAGVAHELNNPAAAAQRGADQLRGAFAKLQQAILDLHQLQLDADQTQTLLEADRLARERATQPVDLDALARSDREAETEAWLDDRGIEGAWEIAPWLVGLGHASADLDRLEGIFSKKKAPVVLNWIGRSFSVYSLLEEIGHGAGRVAEIVKALKAYSYLGQAPVQPVDINEGISNTLIVLRNKLKAGIVVHRHFADDLPHIQAYGGELNQVWTNIIDNAAAAMDGRGEINLRTYRDAGCVVVEIEDTGPGIPPEIQPRIFDPFFTTKAPGAGTGLGLSTSYNIVVQKHHGQIAVQSRPGQTRFTVRLPIRFEEEGRNGEGGAAGGP